MHHICEGKKSKCNIKDINSKDDEISKIKLGKETLKLEFLQQNPLKNLIYIIENTITCIIN